MNKHIKLVGFLIIALSCGIMLSATPVSAATSWDEYVTYTADNYKTGADGHLYWLHTEVTIKYHYVVIGGIPRVTSMTWYKVVHHSRTDSGGHWINFKMCTILEINRDNTDIWHYYSPDRLPDDYVVKYPGILAEIGDTFHDYGFNGIVSLHTSITLIGGGDGTH